MQIVILEDNQDDLERLLRILKKNSRTDLVTAGTIADLLKVIPQEPFLFITDYFLVHPDTGLKAIQEVLKVNPIMHFMVISGDPTVTVLSEIINLNHGFAFLDKNKPDFNTLLMSKVEKLESGLELKVAAAIKMEEEKREREKYDRELIIEAEKALKIIEVL